MKLKSTIKILYFVLVAGILISVIRLFSGTGGSGLGDFIDSLIWTSVALFLSSIIVLLTNFHVYKKSGQLWLLLLISFPLSVKFANHAYIYSLVKLQATTTPEYYLINNPVNKKQYEADVRALTNHIDSLIDVKIVYKPAEKALRYFDGKDYNDTIDRSWAIDLPMRQQYEKTIIDTIIYAPFDSSYFAGLLINKITNEYAKSSENPEGIEYCGNGFIGKKDNGFKIAILRLRTSGSTTLKASSEHLREWYLKRLGLNKGEYNINDTRFWENIDLAELEKEKSQHITTE